jgi:hypothetical protein
MKLTEKPIDADIAKCLPGAAREGAELVGVTLEDFPARIVEAIDVFVATPQKKRWFRKVDHWNERAMPLGALWGTQLVRQFGWEWIHVVQHAEGDDAFEAIGVFDRRRSVGVYPFHYVFGCVENRVRPTILLAYNLWQEGGIPEQAARSYQNLMEGVRHIVPPA